MLTQGIDHETLDSMTEALLRMKTTLVHEAHAGRRHAEPHDADADAKEVA